MFLRNQLTLTYLIMKNHIFFRVLNLKKVNQMSQSQEGMRVQIEN